MLRLSGGGGVARRLAALAQLVAHAGPGRRWLASGGSSGGPTELPSLKAALRAVYRRVHPDLFQDHQPAKEANTRSFKLLHEYLDAAKTGSRVPLPYRFHFWLRSDGPSGSASSDGGGRPAAASEAEAEAGAGPPPGLREVSLTLPPPTRGAPGEAMSASTRKAFGSLLAALGLPSRFGGGAEDEAAEAEANRFVSLREFLPAAVEAVHQHAAPAASAQQQLGALRTALRMGRRVTAAFAEPAASGGAAAQLPLLQRLVKTLDGLGTGLDLGGLTIMLGGPANGVDSLGAIWLAADGTQPAWASYLGGVDLANCRERRALRTAVQAQEAAVAAALGVGMLYTQQEASLGPSYRQALERLAAAAAQRGHVGGGRFRALPILLQPAGSAAAAGAAAAAAASGGSGSGSGSSGPGGCTADSEAGLLAAPMDVAPEQLYAAVEALGGRVLAALQQRQQREAQLAALRTQVERKLMLRRLLRHPGVSDTHFKSCLDRMLANAQKLQGLLHGQAVRVAEINGLPPDRAFIDVAWNWRL